MALSSPSFTVIFDTDVESADFGLLVLEDTTDYAGEGIALSDVIGFFRIDYPDGTFHLGDFATPDIDADVSLIYKSLGIPKDSNGAFMTGTYTFSYHIRVAGAVQPGDYDNEGNTYDYCANIVPVSNVAPLKGGLPVITYENDCFCLVITGTDSTDYGTPTTSTRVFTIYPPPSLGLPSSSTNSATLTYNFQYTGSYELQVNTALTYVTGIFTEKTRVKGSVFDSVLCERDLCALTTCFQTFRTIIATKMAAVGGFKNLPLTDQTDYVLVLDGFIAHDNFLKCGENAAAEVVYQQLKTLLKCDCSCSEDDAPKLVNPYCTGSGSNNSITIVTAGAGITVTSSVVGDTTTYTVAVQQATLDAIATNTTNITANTNNITNILAGTAGNNYRLIENDTSAVGIDADLVEKTLIQETLTGGLLANDGDYLRIKGFYRLAANADQKRCRLYFGAYMLFYSTIGSSSQSIIIEMQMDVTRTSAITQVLNVYIIKGIPGSPSVFISATTASETLSGAILIKLTGQNVDVAAANNIISSRLFIEYHKKA